MPKVAWIGWGVGAIAVLVGLLVTYGWIHPSAFTRLLNLLGSDSLRFERPGSATQILKELIFAACFLFSAASGYLVWLRVRYRSSEAPRFRREALVPTLAFVCVGIFIAVMHFGMRHFAPYDQAVTIDLGWRLHQGQLPYGQFFNQFPPGHYLPLKFAFDVFGPSWHSSVLLTAIVSVTSFVWLFWLVRRITGLEGTSIVVALAATATTGVLFSFWWYNPMSTISACIFLLSAVALAESPSAWQTKTSYLFALISLSIMKPNLAFVLIVTVSIVLVFTVARLVMIILSVAAFAAVNVLLFINHATLGDVVSSYLSVRRAKSFFIQDFVPFGLGGMSFPHVITDSLIIAIPLIAVGLSLRVAKRTGRPVQKALLALCCCGIGSGFIAIATNMELFISDGTLMILASCILLLRLNVSPTSTRLMGSEKAFVLGICSGLIVYGTSLGAMRLRQWIVGPTFMFHEVTPFERVTSYPFFRGLETGENFGRAMGAIQVVVEKYPGARIYFGNTYSFAAAVFDKTPLTVDVYTRESETPRTLPQLLPVDALIPADSVDVLICMWACEAAARKLGLLQNDALSLRNTGNGTFLPSVLVYSRR